MGQRKKHHYIPQFYLKKFCLEEEGKLIGLYNISKEIFVPGAQIRHQACEKYLYGTTDEFEQDLSVLENYSSQIINIMLKSFLPPPEKSNAYAILKRFLLYQMYRTIKAGIETETTINKAFQEYIKFLKKDLKDWKDIVLKHENPTLLSLAYSYKMVPIMDFLSCKLLVNLSELPFITSDNPVVKYNQYMENKGHEFGSTGIASKGLQIFFPIHPRMMVCLYDPFVYKYGEKNKLSIVTESISEVHQLNSLQFIYSESQLFFNHFIIKEYIEMLIRTNKKEKETVMPLSKSFYLTDGNQKRPFLVNTFRDPKIGLNLSFIKLLKKAKRFDTTKSVSFPRHESFIELRKKMSESIGD